MYKRQDKGLALHEILSVEGGLASDVARRAAKGRAHDAHRFLCVLAKSRSLDLEFPTAAARDEWWTTLERWRKAVAPNGAPNGAPASPPRGLALALAGAVSAAAAEGDAAPPTPSEGGSSGATTPQRAAPDALGLAGAARTRISPLPHAGEAPA